MSEDFKIWWHREGSGMPPLKGEDTCEHVERVSAIAWSNGAYKATEAMEATKADNVRLKAKVERLTKALAFSNSLAKDLYGMIDLRMSKKDLIGIGFTKEEADAEWEAYRAAESAAKKRKHP